MDEGQNGRPTTALAFKVRALKAGQLKTLEGKLKATSVEGIKDSFRIIAARDPRIQEIELLDEEGKLIWSLIPGILRSALDSGGLGPDLVQGLPGGRR
jgi:hypothetical protein